MRQLIKVSVTLANIEKPLDPAIRMTTDLVLGGASLIVAFASAFARGAFAIGALIAAFVFLCATVVCLAFPAIFLPASARRFLWRTRAERRDLVRRTEAFNRAWCLAERVQGSLPEAKDDPFRPRFLKLQAEVEAYAARYRAAAAGELAKVGIDVNRRAKREAIVGRSKDLVELEAKLEELGADADLDMRQRASAMRERLETDIRAAGLPLGLVRLRRAATSPPTLPSARTVSR